MPALLWFGTPMRHFILACSNTESILIVFLNVSAAIPASQLFVPPELPAPPGSFREEVNSSRTAAVQRAHDANPESVELRKRYQIVGGP